MESTGECIWRVLAASSSSCHGRVHSFRLPLSQVSACPRHFVVSAPFRVNFRTQVVGTRD